MHVFSLGRIPRAVVLAKPSVTRRSRVLVIKLARLRRALKGEIPFFDSFFLLFGSLKF
jgi:hypothetical protein